MAATSLPRCAVVILAAGAGQRFVGPTHKLMAPLHGRPLWQHAVAHAREANVGPIAVVTGAQRLVGGGDDVELIANPEWVSGQASSLVAGLRWAAGQHAEAVLVGLADQPFIPPATWSAIAGTRADTPIVAARYDGVPGPHPVRLAASVWPQITADGDRGAGPLMRSSPQLVTWVDCVGSVADIDTQEDLTRWTSC